MKEAAGLWLVSDLLPLRYEIVKLVVYFFAVPLLEILSLSSNASYQERQRKLEKSLTISSVCNGFSRKAVQRK